MGLWAANQLTGGASGALDNIPTSVLTDAEERAVVVTTQVVFCYTYNPTSGKTEDPPNIIKPDDTTGDERWELVYSSIIPVEYKTADFAANVFTEYGMDAGVVATLPASPNDKDLILFHTIGDMTSTNGRIARNGNNIMGLAEDMYYDKNSPFALRFYASNNDWRFA